MVLFFGYKREEPLQLIDPAVVPTVYDQVRALDKAINQWIQLFNFPASLIIEGERIFVSEFLSRLAIEILRYWARNERAAKRFAVPPRPATWAWVNAREEELSTITFPPVTWRFRVEKRNEFERRTAEEQKQFLAERLDEIESRLAAMERFERTPRIRIKIGRAHV